MDSSTKAYLPRIRAPNDVDLCTVLNEDEGWHGRDGVLPSYILALVTDEDEQDPMLRVAMALIEYTESRDLHIALEELHSGVLLREGFIFWSDCVARSAPRRSSLFSATLLASAWMMHTDHVAWKSITWSNDFGEDLSGLYTAQ